MQPPSGGGRTEHGQVQPRGFSLATTGLQSVTGRNPGCPTPDTGRMLPSVKAPSLSRPLLGSEPSGVEHGGGLIPIAGMRWLNPTDDQVFGRLLREVYGDTYSYREVYEPGGYGRLLLARRIMAVGEFNALGELIGHTAFLLKDPLADYVEQGMSFRRPAERGTDKDSHSKLCMYLFQYMKERFSFVHQNVTTYHPAAQVYASKGWGAVATAFIVDYAANETVRGIEHANTPMNALSMSARLRRKLPHVSTRAAHLPRGAWGEWLATLLTRVQPEARVVFVEQSAASPEGEFVAERFETNAALQLTRHVLSSRRSSAALLDQAGSRVSLVHLPTNDARLIATQVPRLMAEGYLPVGIRPHGRRADEIIMQYTQMSQAELAARVKTARFASPADQQIFEAWVSLCQR